MLHFPGNSSHRTNRLKAKPCGSGAALTRPCRRGEGLPSDSVYVCPDRGLAAEIKNTHTLHLAIVAGQISGLPVDFVQVLPDDLRRLG